MSIESIINELSAQVPCDLQNIIPTSTAYKINYEPLKMHSDRVEGIVLKTVQVWVSNFNSIEEFSEHLNLRILLGSKKNELQNRDNELSENEEGELKKTNDKIQELDQFRGEILDTEAATQEAAGYFAFFDYEFMKVVKRFLEEKKASIPDEAVTKTPLRAVAKTPSKAVTETPKYLKSAKKVAGLEREEGFLDVKIKQKSLELNKQTRSLRLLQDRIIDIEKTHKKMHVELQKKEQESVKANTALKEETDKVSSIRESLKSMKEEEEKLKAELKKNSDTVGKLQKQIDDAKIKKEDLQKDKNATRADLDKIKKEIPKLMQEFIINRQHRDDALTSLKKIKKEYKELKKNYGEELSSMKKLKRNLSKVKAVITNDEKEYSLQSQLLDEKAKQLNTLKVAIPKINSEIQNTQSTVENLGNSRDLLLLEKEKNLADVTKLENEIKSIKSIMNTLKDDIEIQKKASDDWLEVWQATVKGCRYLEKLTEITKSDLQELKEMDSPFSEEGKKVLDKISSTERDLHELENKIAKQTKEINQQEIDKQVENKDELDRKI